MNSLLPILADSAAKSAVLLALALLLGLAQRKSSAALRHLTCAVALAGALLVPVLSWLLPAWQVPGLRDWRVELAPPPIVAAATSAPVAKPSAVNNAPVSLPEYDGAPSSPANNFPSANPPMMRETPVAQSVMESKKSFDAKQFILRHAALLWFAGAGLALLPLLIGCWQVARLTRRCAAVTEPEWTESLARACADLQLRRRIDLRWGERVPAPLTWGAWRPALLLPAEAKEWPQPRRRMVLLHELAHIKRGDWLTQTVATAACAAYWYNPLAWLALRRMRVERERACDDLVLRSGPRASDYAGELLAFAARTGEQRLLNWAMVPMVRKSSLEGRLLAILDARRNRASLTRVVLGLAFVLAAVVTIPLAMVRGQEEQTAATAASTTTSSVINGTLKFGAAHTPPNDPLSTPLTAQSLVNGAGHYATGLSSALAVGDNALAAALGKASPPPGKVGAVIFVTGAVNNPGAVVMVEGKAMPVMDALTAAGGPNFKGDYEVTVRRQTPNGRLTVMNIASIGGAMMFEGSTLTLQAGDIVDLEPRADAPAKPADKLAANGTLKFGAAHTPPNNPLAKTLQIQDTLSFGGVPGLPTPSTPFSVPRGNPAPVDTGTLINEGEQYNGHGGRTLTLNSTKGGGTFILDGKTGTGTLTLTGTNTYTGGTTINSGSLAPQAAVAKPDVIDTSIPTGNNIVVRGVVKNPGPVALPKGDGEHAPNPVAVIEEAGGVLKSGAYTLTVNRPRPGGRGMDKFDYGLVIFGSNGDPILGSAAGNFTGNFSVGSFRGFVLEAGDVVDVAAATRLVKLTSLNLSAWRPRPGALTYAWGNEGRHSPTLKIGGEEFADGISMVAGGTLYLNLAGGTDKFAATIGMDGNPLVKAIFKVIGDGKTLYESAPKQRGDAPEKISIDTHGIKILALDVRVAGDIHYGDRRDADWADGTFDVTGAQPQAVEANAPEVIPEGTPERRGQLEAFIVEGNVTLIDEQENETPVTRGVPFTAEGKTIMTGPKASALLVFSNGATVKLLDNSTLKVTLFRQAPFDEQVEGTFLRLDHDPSRSNTILDVSSRFRDISADTFQGDVKKLNQTEGSTFVVNGPHGLINVSASANSAGQAAPAPTAAQQGILQGPLATFISQLATETGIKLVPIPAGTFMMGSPADEIDPMMKSEGPQTRVTLTKDYFLGATDVTQGQYEAIMGTNPSYFKTAGKEAPVENVSWDDALAFCKKLTEQERAAGRLMDGYMFSLPTEAQWEYACRAGTIGPRPGDLDAMAWYLNNSEKTVHQVGLKQPNAWGLYDIIGNVEQWCADSPVRYPGGAVTDPVGPVPETKVDPQDKTAIITYRSLYGHVVRGGSWQEPSGWSKSAARKNIPGKKGSWIGFRVALVQSKG